MDVLFTIHGPYVSYDLILKQTHHSSSKEEIRQPESGAIVCSQCRNTRVIYIMVFTKICSHPPNTAGEEACRRFQSRKNIVAHLKDTDCIWSIKLVTVSPTHLRWSHKPNCEEILRNKGLANPSMFFCTSFVIFLKSHDGFSFLLHHWDVFFHLEVLRRFFLLYVELLPRGRDGVL